MSIHSNPEFDDDNASMARVLEQSKREYDKQRELMLDTVYDSDEERRAIETAIRASQSNDAGGGGDGHESSCLLTDDKKDVNKKEEECLSPGVEIVSSTWLSARQKGSPAASIPRKRKKPTNIPVSVLGSPLRSPASHAQRSLIEMLTHSPKKRKLSSDDQNGDGFAVLSQSPESPAVPDGNEGLAARRRHRPISVDVTTSAGTPPSSAGSAKCVTPIRFSPHPSTLTKSGDRSFGGGCHEAVAEFIDNAIEASREHHQQEITIHLFVASDDEKKAAIAICDRGKGMTKGNIEDFARYSHSIEDRRGGEQPYQTSIESRHIDGRLSVYGVGSKNAAFHLGSRLTVITKSKEAKQMSVFCMDSQKLHSSFEKNEDMYCGDIYDYDVADVTCLHENSERQDDNISEMVKSVSSHKHFTIILIGGLKKDHIVALKKQHAAEFRQGLAHIYYYYLHGIDEKAAESHRQGDRVSLKVKYYQRSGEKPKTFDLVEEATNKEYLYLSKSKASYKFAVDLRIEDKSGDKVYQVQGLLLYFPSTLATPSETIPFQFDSHELFECFWQGRLVSHTLIPCLNFCKLREQRVATQKDKLPDNCYKRLKGMLFFDRTMPTGHNKLNLLLPPDKLARMLNSCVRKREEKKFTEWLQKCHRDLDEEWVFCDETETGSGRYKTLKLSESGHLGELRAGDHICVKRTNPHMYGEVTHFAKDPDCVYISRRPFEMYPWTDKVQLPRLDFHECRLDDARWKNAMDEQKRKMPVRLRVGCLEDGQYSLDDISECTPSTAVSREGFWIRLYDGNNLEIKRLPGHKHDLVVAMKVQNIERDYEVEGSTEGFRKFSMMQTGKHTFKFTVINRRNRDSQDVVLLEWVHDVKVTADPPFAIHVVNVSREVRLGSKEFAVDVDVMDQFHNPCKGVRVDVSLSCSNKALEVSIPTGSVTTDGDGRFRLSEVQFLRHDHTDGALTSTGSHVVSLLVNDTMEEEMKVTVGSGPPASLQIVKPVTDVEQNSVFEKFLVKVLDAYHQAATVHQGEQYRVAARFLNGETEGTARQYTDALPAGSRGRVAFHHLKFAFPDITATVGQLELALLRLENDDENSREVQVCPPLVSTVHITPSCEPVRLLLYDDIDQPVGVDDMIVAPVGCFVSLAVEALDARDQTVDLLDRMRTHPNSYRLQISWTEQSSSTPSVLAIESLGSVGGSSDISRFLLPPIPVPEKANSLVRHSVVLTAENDVEVSVATIIIKPQPSTACQVVIDKHKRSAAVGCGNEGELRQLLSFFLADTFGNKLYVDETTDVRAKIIADTDESDCYGEGDWQLEREVLELMIEGNVTQSYTLFRLPASAVVVGRGKATISAEATGCDRNMTYTLKIQPGRPQRVEVQSEGFDDSQSFSDIHAMKFIRDQPLPAISAIVVDRGGNEVKRHIRSRHGYFSAEIRADGTTYSKVSFKKSTNECPLTIPDGLSARAFTIRVEAETEDEVQAAQINCLVRLTNRVNAITLRDLNSEVLNDEFEFHAGSPFPAIKVSVETEDGLAADIDWNDMIVTARSPQGRCFRYECGERVAASCCYSYSGSDTLTDAGVYQLTARFEDKREDLRQIYPSRQLKLQSEAAIAVLAGSVDGLLITLPEGYRHDWRPVVICDGNEEEQILLPVQTLISAVDAHGNIVDDFCGSLGFSLVRKGATLTSTSCLSEGFRLRANPSFALSGGRMTLDTSVTLQTTADRASSGSYCLHVFSTESNLRISGSLAVTLTAQGAESVVRELQDCSKRKDWLEKEKAYAQSAITEVDGRVKDIRAKLRDLGCVQSVNAITESNVRQYVLDAESKLDELLRNEGCRRKPVCPPDCATVQLPDNLQSTTLGRVVNLAFVEDEIHARLISSHLGERVLSAFVFPKSHYTDEYLQAPRENCPSAISLDVASEATRESIKDDLRSMGLTTPWKLACDCVDVYRRNSDVRCLIDCLLKDTLITDTLASARTMLNLCRHGNDLRAVPDILSEDGYRVTAVGLVEKLLDDRAQSTFVFGQESTRASEKYEKCKRNAELLAEVEVSMTELKTLKVKRKETLKTTESELEELSDRISLLEREKRELENSK